MSTDTDEGGEDRMQKLDVRVPASLLEAIEEEYVERGYASRSEAIRDALRDWVNPPASLSREVLADLEESSAQRERGDTHSLEDVAAEYDVDLDGDR